MSDEQDNNPTNKTITSAELIARTGGVSKSFDRGRFPPEMRMFPSQEEARRAKTADKDGATMHVNRVAYGGGNAEITDAEVMNAQKAEIARLRAEVERLTAERDAALAREAALRSAAESEIANAMVQCGGGGEGCVAFRAYYDTAERRHAKCGGCPMGVLWEIRAALAAHPAPAVGEGETDNDA